MVYIGLLQSSLGNGLVMAAHAKHKSQLFNRTDTSRRRRDFCISLSLYIYIQVARMPRLIQPDISHESFEDE